MILCFGDSFTEGRNVFDPDLRWPGQLTTMIGQPTQVMAIGGASNDRISRLIKETLPCAQADWAIVGWTLPDRNELSHRDGSYVRALPYGCLTDQPNLSDLDQLHRNWINYNYNIWINFRNWIHDVLFYQDYFHRCGIPFKFFVSFGTNYINEFLNETDQSLALADQSYQWRDRAQYQPERTIHQEWQELVHLCRRIDLSSWIMQNQHTMHGYLDSEHFVMDSTGHPQADGYKAWGGLIAKEIQ